MFSFFCFFLIGFTQSYSILTLQNECIYPSSSFIECNTDCIICCNNNNCGYNTTFIAKNNITMTLILNYTSEEIKKQRRIYGYSMCIYYNLYLIYIT